MYDSRRPPERTLARRWLTELKAASAALVLRRNYPYNGRGDGLATQLRKRYGGELYIGIELEVNQRFVATGGTPWTALRGQLLEALRTALAQ